MRWGRRLIGLVLLSGGLGVTFSAGATTSYYGATPGSPFAQYVGNNVYGCGYTFGAAEIAQIPALQGCAITAQHWYLLLGGGAQVPIEQGLGLQLGSGTIVLDAQWSPTALDLYVNQSIACSYPLPIAMQVTSTCPGDAAPKPSPSKEESQPTPKPSCKDKPSVKVCVDLNQNGIGELSGGAVYERCAYDELAQTLPHHFLTAPAKLCGEECQTFKAIAQCPDFDKNGQADFSGQWITDNICDTLYDYVHKGDVYNGIPYQYGYMYRLKGGCQPYECTTNPDVAICPDADQDGFKDTAGSWWPDCAYQQASVNGQSAQGWTLPKHYFLGDDHGCGLLDCDPTDKAIHPGPDGLLVWACQDHDGDGFANVPASNQTNMCAAGKGLQAPAPPGYFWGYPDCQPSDCDDDPTDDMPGEPPAKAKWQQVAAWRDLDGDGYFGGTKLYLCIGQELPPGYTDVAPPANAVDCNDWPATPWAAETNPETVWVFDADGDGCPGTYEYPSCTTPTIDPVKFPQGAWIRKAQIAQDHLETDCEETNPKRCVPDWYADADRDGVGTVWCNHGCQPDPKAAACQAALTECAATNALLATATGAAITVGAGAAGAPPSSLWATMLQPAGAASSAQRPGGPLPRAVPRAGARIEIAQDWHVLGPGGGPAAAPWWATTPWSAGAAGVFAATAPAALGSAATALPAPYATTPGDCDPCNQNITDGNQEVYLDIDGDGYGDGASFTLPCHAYEEKKRDETQASLLKPECVEQATQIMKQHQLSGLDAEAVCTQAIASDTLWVAMKKGDGLDLSPEISPDITWGFDGDSDGFIRAAGSSPMPLSELFLQCFTPSSHLFTFNAAHPPCQKGTFDFCQAYWSSPECIELFYTMQFAKYNGFADCNDTDPLNLNTFSEDLDGDTVPNANTLYCSLPSGVPVVAYSHEGDCEDLNAQVGEAEKKYADDDGDGFGDPHRKWSLCPGDPHPEGVVLVDHPNDFADYYPSPSVIENMAFQADGIFYLEKSTGFKELCFFEDSEWETLGEGPKIYYYGCLPMVLSELLAKSLLYPENIPVLNEAELSSDENGTAFYIKNLTTHEVIANYLQLRYGNLPLIIENPLTKNKVIMINGTVYDTTVKSLKEGLGGCIAPEGLLGVPIQHHVLSDIEMSLFSDLGYSKSFVFENIKECLLYTHGIYNIKGTKYLIKMESDDSGQFLTAHALGVLADAVPTLSVPIDFKYLNDTDKDGLANEREDINTNGIVESGETDPWNPDTDGDGHEDGVEVVDGDTTAALNPQLQPYADSCFFLVPQILTNAEKEIWDSRKAMALKVAPIVWKKIQKTIPVAFFSGRMLEEAIQVAIPAYIRIKPKCNATTYSYASGGYVKVEGAWGLQASTYPNDEVYIDLKAILKDYPPMSIEAFKSMKDPWNTHLLDTFLHEAMHAALDFTMFSESNKDEVALGHLYIYSILSNGKYKTLEGIQAFE
ncbi:MAG: hypothetical protein HYV02_01350 [Deltaproteobacteria bacterium]|nr:hypothetical protein [Deltaproteobacteria bacterium]